MNILDSVPVAIDMLRLHKLRAFLTMLGVIIGVMSVTLIIMASQGFKHFLTYQLEQLGSDTMIIMFDPGRIKPGESLGDIEGLTFDDVKMLEERCPSLLMASAILQAPASQVTSGALKVDNPRVYCTDEKQAEMSRVGLSSGRNLTREDLESRANVCVVGDEVAKRLFPKGSPLSQLVTFEGIALEVVGVMNLVDIMGQNNGKDVWMPITTAHTKWLGGDSVSYITARPKDSAKVNASMDDIWRVLMAKSGGRAVYRVDSRESIINVLGSIIGVAQTVLAAIAALSLLVGGIGIMNIMLVSVTERTREIGLRKAVGAQYAMVLSQFLVESAILSLVGGLIGMAMAWGLGQIISISTALAQKPTPEGLPMPFPVEFAIGAAVFSALIGVVFGVYPAARAAGLSPIEALRTE